MSVTIFRVVVRGMFADLTPECRERLLAEAPQHDIFDSAYTAAGTFTYEPRLEAFSFRFEIRENSDESDSPTQVEANAIARGESAAVDYLASNGIGFKRIRTSATNMADMWRPSGNEDVSDR